MRITIIATGFDGVKSGVAKKKEEKKTSPYSRETVQEKTAELEPDDTNAEEVLGEEVFDDVATLLNKSRARATQPQQPRNEQPQAPVNPRFGRRFS